MPPRPVWPLKARSVLGQIQKEPQADYGRRDVQRLFRTSARTAHAILMRLGARDQRGQLVVDHETLVARLAALAKDPKTVQEERRVEHLVRALTAPPPVRFFRRPAPVTSLQIPGVSTEPGRIVIDAPDPRSALQRLFQLAQAIDRDPVAFADAIARR